MLPQTAVPDVQLASLLSVVFGFFVAPSGPETLFPPKDSRPCCWTPRGAGRPGETWTQRPSVCSLAGQRGPRAPQPQCGQGCISTPHLPL